MGGLPFLAWSPQVFPVYPGAATARRKLPSAATVPGQAQVVQAKVVTGGSRGISREAGGGRKGRGGAAELGGRRWDAKHWVGEADSYLIWGFQKVPSCCSYGVVCLLQ